MQNKKGDVMYCNVWENIIKKASPKFNSKNLKLLEYWIKEMYFIHLKKDVHKIDYPWTDDKILKKYRFTNVRREHDKETKWLIKNICLNDKINYENKLLNIILFRLFNKSLTLEKIGIINFDKEVSNIAQEPNKIYFSNAFFTSGPKTAANKLFKEINVNMITKIIKLVHHYKKLNLIEKIKTSQNQKQVFDNLLELPGIGRFFAYQVFVDFTYIIDFPFSENEFTIAGPGCIGGLNLIFENFGGMNHEEALFWLRDNQEKLFNFENLFEDLPKYDQKMNVMSLENCMCEISKYLRAKEGNGRPRVKYIL